MPSVSILFSAAFAVAVSAGTFKFPLPNGFPDVSPATLKAIEYVAGGPMPGSSGGPSTPLKGSAAQALQALAFNEIFEVAFFTQLLHNVTKNVPGYELGSDWEQIIAGLNATQAQEEVHYLNANDGLKGSTTPQVQPCEYMFPVTTFQDAMKMADDFTSMLMGAIPAVITDFGAAPIVVQQLGTVASQEGSQDGYFRWLIPYVPNQSPFPTTTTLALLFNHLNQHFVKPGSCPQTFSNIPRFNKLLALESPPPKNTTISLRTTQPDVTTDDHLAYMSGQITPVTVKITNIVHKGNETTFDAPFPYEGSSTQGAFSRGLIVAALVNSGKTFTNETEVTDAAIAGPALMQVNYD